MKGINNTLFVQKMIGSRVREARENKGLSRPEFARLLEQDIHAPVEGNTYGLSINRLKQWEYGNNPVSLEWIPAICNVLECDVGYLFGDYAEKTRSISDIVDKTGLSPLAAENLLKIKTTSNGEDFWAKIIDFLSFLLERSNAILIPTIVGASQCIDTMLERTHYQNEVLPKLSVPPDDERAFLLHHKFNDCYVDIVSKRTKVRDKIKQLNDICDARLYHCEKNASAAIEKFIMEEVERIWLTSKNAETKKEH